MHTQTDRAPDIIRNKVSPAEVKIPLSNQRRFSKKIKTPINRRLFCMVAFNSSILISGVACALWLRNEGYCKKQEIILSGQQSNGIKLMQEKIIHKNIPEYRSFFTLSN